MPEKAHLDICPHFAHLHLVGVKSSQAFRLLLKGAPVGRRKSSGWLEAHATFLIAQLSRDGAVHQERRYRVGGLGLEHEGTVRLGEDLGPPGMRQEGGIPGGEEPHRRRRVGVGQGRSW